MVFGPFAAGHFTVVDWYEPLIPISVLLQLPQYFRENAARRNRGLRCPESALCIQLVHCAAFIFVLRSVSYTFGLYKVPVSLAVAYSRSQFGKEKKKRIENNGESQMWQSAYEFSDSFPPTPVDVWATPVVSFCTW